ncbi:MAG: KEOPS complex kinase/ATPase Bud32 [Candidatus Pacearchaeota archaeon]
MILKKPKLIAEGAEAQIFLNNENKIIKKRQKKSYRHPKIDEKIRKLRTRSEGKILEKASKIISVPKIILSNEIEKEIIMEFIKEEKLSKNLNSFTLKKQREIFELMGENIAKLHKENIIHGDLTTSNMIFVKDKNKLFFLDFGLGFISKKIEDKSVDLHLLKQALEAKHYKNWKTLFEEVSKGYNKTIGQKEFRKILDRMNAVEKRRRYRN